MRRTWFRALMVLSVGAGVALSLVGCGGNKQSAHWPAKPGLRVAVSFPPYYCFAANVVGDVGSVKSVLTSQGPHHADTNVSERAILEEANLFLINGLDLDDALAGSLKGSTGNKDLKIVSIGDKLKHSYLLEPGEGCCTHDHGKADGKGDAKHDHPHDPHVWTSPLVAQELVKIIRSTLRKQDPANEATYNANADAYVEKLKTLFAEGQTMLKGKKNKSIVTMHGSLGYLANSYDIEIIGVIQKTPGQDPNSNELKELIAKCVAKKVQVICVEPQYPSEGAAKIVKDELTKAGIADVTIVEIDPLETAIPSELNAEWYETKTRANLEKLAKALK